MFCAKAEAMNTKLNDSQVVNNDTLKKLCHNIPVEVQKCALALGAAMDGLSETNKEDLKEDAQAERTPPPASSGAAA